MRAPDPLILRSMKGATMTFRVKPTAGFRIRVWLGIRLCVLGAKVMGYSVNVVTDDQDG